MNTKDKDSELLFGCALTVVLAVIVLWFALSVLVITEQIEIEYKFVENDKAYVLYRAEDDSSTRRSEVDFDYYLCVESGDSVSARINALGNIKSIECPGE